MFSAEFIARHWGALTPVSLLLFPVSLVFRLLVALRRLAYSRGVFRSARLPVPVLVVGNLTAGGSGKTPLVLALVAALSARGWRPGILSRGYGGNADGAMAVDAAARPEAVGDEPVLLARRGGCPVWVGRDRVAAGAALLAAHPDCTLLILDDGLQHLAIERDFEISVEDARGHGNGMMLPAGPLREPPDRSVDAVVTNGFERPGAFAMRLGSPRLYPVGHPGVDVGSGNFAGKRLHAVAGIGHPARFFDALAALGLRARCHAFPDHHPFSPQDLQFADCDAVLMTEKDAVKCEGFGRDDLFVLAVDAEVDPALFNLIDLRLHGRTPS